VLRSSDVFLNSGFGEDISMTALNAMACALPVVTSDSGGLREAVADGVEGLVVPAWNPGAMAHALADLGADAGRRQRMGAAARARVASPAKASIADLLTLCQDAARPLA
jgi:glycosyltransferase involved in cell wall biosynthesis